MTWELREDASVLSDIPQQRPQGPLQGLVGPRIDARETDSEKLEEASEELLSRIAAWPVLPLVGASFEVKSVDHIADAVRELLGSKLPGIDWWVHEDWRGPFEKYGIVHGSMPAPPNPATGEPMALELYGKAEVPRISGPMRSPFESRPRGEGQAAVRYPVRVVIRAATYANITFPGFGVPFYM